MKYSRALNVSLSTLMHTLRGFDFFRLLTWLFQLASLTLRPPPMHSASSLLILCGGGDDGSCAVKTTLAIRINIFTWSSDENIYISCIFHHICSLLVIGDEFSDFHPQLKSREALEDNNSHCDAFSSKMFIFGRLLLRIKQTLGFFNHYCLSSRKGTVTKQTLRCSTK